MSLCPSIPVTCDLARAHAQVHVGPRRQLDDELHVLGRAVGDDGRHGPGDVHVHRPASSGPSRAPRRRRPSGPRCGRWHRRARCSRPTPAAGGRGRPRRTAARSSSRRRRRPGACASASEPSARTPSDPIEHELHENLQWSDGLCAVPTARCLPAWTCDSSRSSAASGAGAMGGARHRCAARVTPATSVEPVARSTTCRMARCLPRRRPCEPSPCSCSASWRAGAAAARAGHRTPGRHARRVGGGAPAFPRDELSPGLRRDIDALAGKPLARPDVTQLARRIEEERPEVVVAVRIVARPGDEARVFFLVARISDDAGLGSNINARYTVESVEIEGLKEHEISAALRDRLQALVGTRLDPAAADTAGRGAEGRAARLRRRAAHRARHAARTDPRRLQVLRDRGAALDPVRETPLEVRLPLRRRVERPARHPDRATATTASRSASRSTTTTRWSRSTRASASASRPGTSAPSASPPAWRRRGSTTPGARRRWPRSRPTRSSPSPIASGSRWSRR